MHLHLLTAAALTVAAVATPSLAAGVRIDDLIIGRTAPKAQAAATLKAAKAFYAFWDTGDRATLERAISPAFVDHTLPPGRPQGPEGPAFASASFRKAVPDLRVEVVKMVVAGDYVTVHMVFTGHFSGAFGPTSGKGQPIRFIATDLIRVRDGRVTDNWHIEDNLTFFQQAGLVPAS
jgi:predicted ester cyclase